MTPEPKLRVQPPSVGSGHGAATAPARDVGERIGSPAEQAIDRATRYLLSAQNHEGYWWAELEADTTLESDYILYLHILGQLDSEKTPKLAKYIRDRQLPDGGWNIFYGGPSELNATVKAYVALRLAGDSAIAPHMESAKRKDSRAGRPGSNEFLCAVLSGDGGSDRLEHGSRDSARADAAAGVVPGEHLRDVVVDARHRDSTGDCFYASKPEWRLPEGITFDELFKSARREATLVRMGQAGRLVAEFLPRARPRPEAVRALCPGSRFGSCAGAGAEVDARTAGAQRRPGNDLPGDDEFDFCAAGLGRRRDRSAGRRVRFGFLERYEIEEQDGDSRAALHFSRLGHGDRHGFARRSWTRSGASVADRGRALAARQSESSAPATGR